jgi:hypothetical protein
MDVLNHCLRWRSRRVSSAANGKSWERVFLVLFFAAAKNERARRGTIRAIGYEDN